MLAFKDNDSKKGLKHIRDRLNKRLSNNIFNHVIMLIEASKKKYLFSLTENTGKIINADRLPDARFDFMEKKPAYLYPPEGCDSYVEVDYTIKFTDAETETKMVNNVNLIFHELFEAYCKIDVGMDHIASHNYAYWIEKDVLMKQFENMGEYPAGGTLHRV